jgi:hypothetical protein
MATTFKLTIDLGNDAMISGDDLALALDLRAHLRMGRFIIKESA